MPNKQSHTYVIGHANPDTDSIAAAMGYAWLLRAEGEDVSAARAGHLNPQTTWVLDRLRLDAPVLLQDASPRFEAVCHRFNTTKPDSPLRDVWSVANRTGGVAPIVDEDGKPYGLVTVLSLFEFLSRLVGSHARKEETKIGELFDRTCKEACDTSVPKFQAHSRIRDMLPRILREERNDFWVVDDEGRYVGICRQRDVLKPPRMKIIMVDHNESSQALGSLDEADLIEVIDHHRLGNDATRAPIRFTIDVVGSTSTLISEKISDAGLSAPPDIAGLLLSGLISDTLILTSPTTTDRDRTAAERLAHWAFVGGSPLEGETIQSYGEQILHAGSGLASRSPKEIVNTDLKPYEAGGLSFGIAQVEVTNRSQLADHVAELREALMEVRERNKFDFAMLMVTDVVRTASRLIFTNDVPALAELPYPRRADGTLDADGVVSRKKQLLPAILGALEG